MCIYRCVCIYWCVCVSIDVCICMYEDVHVYMCMYNYTYVSMNLWMYVCISKYLSIWVYCSLNICMYVCVEVCVWSKFLYMFVSVLHTKYLCIYTQTYAHILTCTSSLKHICICVLEKRLRNRTNISVEELIEIFWNHLEEIVTLWRVLDNQLLEYRKLIKQIFQAF